MVLLCLQSSRNGSTGALHSADQLRSVRCAASLGGAVNVSGSGRGMPTPLVPVIGFTCEEEGLDSFGTKDLYSAFSSYIVRPIVSTLSSPPPRLPRWSWRRRKKRRSRENSSKLVVMSRLGDTGPSGFSRAIMKGKQHAGCCGPS